MGKKEQGIAMALQVEKTSKRGGRIIHEKDMMPPPLFAVPSVPVPTPQPASSSIQLKPEPSITEIMREPSKVVLLRVCLTLVFDNFTTALGRIAFLTVIVLSAEYGWSW